VTAPAPGSLTAEDELQINALYRRYARAADEGDGEGYAACFTANGLLESVAGERIEGRKALAAYARRVRDGARDRGVQLRMWLDNVLLEASGDGAVGSAYILAFEIAPGSAPRPIFSGIYEDRLVREDGRWLLAVRRAGSDA
jgi:uncharacterized protein (TIGR02246 family)